MKNIFKHTRLIIVTALCCWLANYVQAQRATELFIPLGKSPGLSGKYCVMGKVETVNTTTTTMTIKYGTDSKTCKIIPVTEIYLDKSKRKQANTKGSFADIKQGRIVEIKYKDNKQDGWIEWVKVQIE